MTAGTWRLVDSGLIGPAESAAVDEAILECHSRGLVGDTLHFYARSRPTVSIGYFQKVGDAVDAEECSRRGVSLVRRRSGGSCIFTDQGQLIYAVVLPASAIGSGEGSFALVCEPIARALRSLGVDARHRPVNDIEVGGRKVSGSAQLRRRGSVLQHGTVLVDADVETMDAVLRPSPLPPSARIATLTSLLGSRVDPDRVKDAMVRELSQSFSVSLNRQPLSRCEEECIDELVRTRYGRDEWNLRL